MHNRRNVDQIGITWQQGDLSYLPDCEAFVRDLDVIIHLAHTNTPLSSHRDWSSDATLNIIPSLNLIEAIRKQGRPINVVYASSGGAIYGASACRHAFKEEDPSHPSSPYGLVKLAIENYFKLASEQGWLRAVALRIGNPYGVPLPSERRQGLIGVAISQVLRGEPIPIYGDPRNVRDYIHLSDVAKMVEHCLQPQDYFETYNVGSGYGASTNEILDLIERVIGREVQRKVLDKIDNADRLISWSALDITKAQRKLGWQPRISLEQGIRRLYQQFSDKG